ncbi:hypothetical protein GTY66_01480 [Streptomyces sp. SID8356]|uniref:hypothetical protein n=1 Tax=unclassified Streptomyces TaxID=2593676 RepID=UPI00036C16C8|nr:MULTISPECIES: hypothetical protein [unclassified Streptomyces]MYT34744.1 hypothetical protein [Streptomyces sp. SID8356]
MNVRLGPLTAQRRSESDPLRAGGGAVGTLGDFWQWACSDLVGNTMRGVLAEYIVGTALGCVDGTRVEWDTVDIRTPEGCRIEVKSAAYLQSWAQKALSKISFSIAPTARWDAAPGTVSPEVVRRSDAYVFCLLHHQDKQSLDPLDLTQWTFYVLPTRVLDERCPTQKTISLAGLQRLEPVQTGFSGLAEAVTGCDWRRSPTPSVPRSRLQADA